MTRVVRAARAADAEALTRVRLASWRAAYGALLPESVWARMDPDVIATRWRERIEDPRAGTTLVAEVGDDIAGYTIFGPCRDDDADGITAEIYAIYVHPDHWSAGVGRALMSAALTRMETRPVTLWVLTANERARRFYERSGFVADGHEQDALMPGDTTLPELRYCYADE